MLTQFLLILYAHFLAHFLVLGPLGPWQSRMQNCPNAPGYHHDVIQEREFWHVLTKITCDNLCLAPLTSFNGDQNGSVLHGCHIGWLLAHLALQWVLQRQNDNKSNKIATRGTKKLCFSLGQGPNCLMAHDGKICLDNLISLLARTIRSLLGFAAKSLLELQHQSGLIHCSS